MSHTDTRTAASRRRPQCALTAQQHTHTASRITINQRQSSVRISTVRSAVRSHSGVTNSYVTYKLCTGTARTVKGSIQAGYVMLCCATGVCRLKLYVRHCSIYWRHNHRAAACGCAGMIVSSVECRRLQTLQYTIEPASSVDSELAPVGCQRAPWSNSRPYVPNAL